jgi:hypothetical protein
MIPNESYVIDQANAGNHLGKICSPQRSFIIDETGEKSNRFSQGILFDNQETRKKKTH